MKVKKVKDRIFLWSNSSGEIKNLKDLYDCYYWNMRVRRHRRWELVCKFIIKKIALGLLKRSNMYYNHIQRYKVPPKIETLKKAYKSTLYHKVCGKYNTDINYYSKKMNVAEYIFFGNTDYEIYTELIYHIILRPICYPYCIKGGVIGAMSRKFEK